MYQFAVIKAIRDYIMVQDYPEKAVPALAFALDAARNLRPRERLAVIYAAFDAVKD